MIREVKFESQDRRMKQILAALKEHGISSIEEANKICDSYGIDPYKACEETQPICFENAKWAYVVGCAIALKEGEKTGDKSAVKAAENIGIGLQSFCIPGSVADDRKVGLGHGNLAARLLSEPIMVMHAKMPSKYNANDQKTPPNTNHMTLPIVFIIYYLVFHYNKNRHRSDG